MATTTTKKTSTKTGQTKTTSIDKEYAKKLEERIAQLEKLLTMQMQINNSSVATTSNTERDVILTSLTVGVLNLSTEGYGQGDVYTFTKFGEEQAIPYDDVKKIVKNNKSFIEGGYVFINDDEIIASQKLTNVYKKLLSADKIMNLFNENKKDFSNIYGEMTQIQKEIFRDVIYTKLNNNEDVDMNIIQVVNEALNIDIISNFKASKDLTVQND